MILPSRLVILGALASLAAALALELGAITPARALSARARNASSTVMVRTMVVGVGGKVLAPARQIAAPASTVRVGSRSCAVAADTPLAVLAALARHGGPHFTLHDYGHCGSAPANSGELFVTGIGGEPASGADGWEYKLGNSSGSAGAGDPHARLKAGARVLWFWCTAVGEGCQRTLDVSAPARVAAGAGLKVLVRGYDNEGHAIPVAGARVELGSSSALTASDGEATLSAPKRAGAYSASASASGLVPSFPREVRVS